MVIITSVPSLSLVASATRHKTTVCENRPYVSKKDSRLSKGSAMFTLSEAIAFSLKGRLILHKKLHTLLSQAQICILMHATSILMSKYGMSKEKMSIND
jgi:hypothetical protein